MRILEQTSLVFRASGTEKVHEVDLCEVGPNRYVVNFRYGRRGTALKDGSRTVLPVGLAEARLAYQKEIASKVEKGYEIEAGVIPGGGAETAPRPAAPPPPAPRPTLSVVPAPSVAVARHQALLDRLVQGDNPVMPTRPDSGSSTFRSPQRRLVRSAPRIRKPRPLNRVILRVGELRIREAEPYLLEWLGKKDTVRDYVCALALGRLGSERCIEPMMALMKPTTPPMLRRAIFEALRNLSDAPSRLALSEDRISRLPAGLQPLVRAGNPDPFQTAFRELKEADQVGFLEELYRIDLPAVRPTLLAYLQEIPLRPPWFRVLRSIFKAAEYRRDAEVFGVIARRFEKTQALFRVKRLRRGGLQAILEGGRRVKFERTTMSSQTTELAYSDRTRWYLRQRVWRLLRRLGQAEDSDYVKMAVGVLQAWKDTDAVAVRVVQEWDPQARRQVQIHFDKWSTYWSFNQILYRYSSRYHHPFRSRVWRCRPTWRPGQLVPTAREEAFPALWDREPAGLLHLLAESGCEAVHLFAVRALRQNPMLSQLGADEAAMLLARPYEGTATLGLEIARRVYDPLHPHAGMLLAAAASVLHAARSQGWAWIRQNPVVVLGDAVGLARLCMHPSAETRQLARNLLTEPGLQPTQGMALMVRLCAEILALRGDEARIQDCCEVVSQLLKRFGLELSQAVLNDLLLHPSAAVQRFVAGLLMAMPVVPDGVLVTLLASPHASVREEGLRLYSRIPDQMLAERPELVVAICVSPAADVRMSSTLLVRRLCRVTLTFGQALAYRLTDALLVGQPEGVHPHLVNLLRDELHGFLAEIPVDRVHAMLKSKRPPVQEAAGVILQHRRDLAGLDLTAVATLAHHEILAVRLAVWPLFDANLPLLKARLGDVLKVLDSPWEETRTAAFRFFFEKLDPQELSIEVLVAMADSNRSDVQAFAEQLLLRAFREEQALPYLLKLSEHPSARIQGFAANYLETAAAGKLEVLKHLESYFRTILSRVNKGRVAKVRIQAFLSEEAKRNPETAQFVSALLSRQVVTMAVEDRARSIQTLVRIHREHPELSWPGRLIEPPLRAS